MPKDHDVKLIEAARSLCLANQAMDSSGHSYFHSLRVYSTALALQKEEGGDATVIAIAALLHDINDSKRIAAGSPRVDLGQYLRDHGADNLFVDRVLAVIAAIHFKGGMVEDSVPDQETAVVLDADRLDAIGAIGIARVFAYGGSDGREIHDPSAAAKLHEDEASYRANKSTLVNHFHEKLLLLKDRMNTAAGKRLAAGRHGFMEEFLVHFHNEWSGLE